MPDLNLEGMFPEEPDKVPKNTLEAISATERLMAVAAAGTRGRRKWGYVPEGELRKWAEKNKVTGTDEELVRAFFSAKPDAPLARGISTALGVPVLAVWTHSELPMYVYKTDLDAWVAANNVQLPDDEERALAFFKVDDETTPVDQAEDDEGKVYLSVRTKKNPSFDRPPSF